MAPSKTKRSNSKKLKLSNYLPYIMSVSATEVSRLIARAYEDDFDITIAQWRLLAHLGEGGPTTPLEIGAKTLLDKVAVSRAARGLLQRKLVEGRRNDADGRSHILSLTPQGQALYQSVAPAALAFESALLDQWTAEEIETLKSQLRRLQHRAALLTKLR